MLDIMVASSRLHRGADRLYHRVNSIPDVRAIPSNHFIPHFRRHINHPIPRNEQENDEPETVLVNLKVDSDEQPQTKYVNLYIDTKRKVNISSLFSKIIFIF